VFHSPQQVLSETFFALISTLQVGR